MLNSGLIKTAISMIGQDKIGSMASDLLKKVITQKNLIELQPGEVDVVILLYNKNEDAYYTLAFIDENDKIVRYDQTQKIESFISEMLKNI